MDEEKKLQTANKTSKQKKTKQKNLKAHLSRSKEITYSYMSDKEQSDSPQSRKIIGLRKTE